MAEQSYFMGQDGFVWFVGVVEDRNDPERLGRVRVRCLGFHTEDLNSLPTADLPWAHVMHPVTDPAMHGMGSTPSFLVEGSWVIGFFRDAQEKQQPVIIGSLPGRPGSPADYTKGFNDPRSRFSVQPGKAYSGDPTYGPYPLDGDEYSMKSGHSVGETDTNRLAQGKTSETHSSLINRRLNRLRGDPAALDPTVGIDDTGTTPNTTIKGTGVPTATQPYLSTVSDAAVQEVRSFWNEPDPKSIKKYAAAYISSQYPFNHVHESESGHIHEIDDSPGAERLFRQHTSGTFEEIHPKGDKVVKVIGDNYEIVAGSSNVSISGNVNLTIAGTVRELIKGDYHLEVEGNYTQKIHKNHRVKVGASEGGGNREEELIGNHAYNIKDNVKATIGGFVDTIIDKSELRIINDTSRLSVVNNLEIASYEGDVAIVAKENLSTTTISGITSFKSGDKLNMKSANAMVIKSEDSITESSETTLDSTAGTIYTIKSGGDDGPTSTNIVDINPS